MNVKIVTLFKQTNNLFKTDKIIFTPQYSIALQAKNNFKKAPFTEAVRREK